MNLGMRKGDLVLLVAALIPSTAAFAGLPNTIQSCHGIGTVFSSGKSKLTMASVESGSVVTIECQLRPENDFVPEPLFDGIVLEADAPSKKIAFVLGEGNYLPGLHDLVSTMTEGQTVKDVSLDAGWGSWNPKLSATLSLDALEPSGIEPSQIVEGVELELANGLRATVVDLTNGDFTIDANPPLAGASYLATVNVLSVEPGVPSTELEYSPNAMEGSKYQVATFALGCFWGGELEYMREDGVVGTKVGYTQGQTEDPSYEDVCTGSTGHTESIMVTFDPSVVSYESLVQLAMNRLGENKYLLNQVGNDTGTQYRHGVYYHNDAQKKVAEAVIQSYGVDCVTECLPATKFYVAEDYHQQYLLKGGQSARKGEVSTIRCYG